MSLDPTEVLSARINELITQHGGLRAAARALGMSPSYMHRIREGEHPRLSEATLKKLGLELNITYIRPTRRSTEK